MSQRLLTRQPLQRRTADPTGGNVRGSGKLAQNATEKHDCASRCCPGGHGTNALPAYSASSGTRSGIRAGRFTRVGYWRVGIGTGRRNLGEPRCDGGHLVISRLGERLGITSPLHPVRLISSAAHALGERVVRDREQSARRREAGLRATDRQIGIPFG
jgi:hypothetical protein